MKQKNIATFFALAAAALYAINLPFSKLLLTRVQPTMMAAFLYLGAGLGLLMLGERPAPQFYAALVLMLAATVLMIRDTISLQHTHEHTHSHTHIHGEDEGAHRHSHETLEDHHHVHPAV